MQELFEQWREECSVDGVSYREGEERILVELGGEAREPTAVANARRTWRDEGPGGSECGKSGREVSTKQPTSVARVLSLTSTEYWSNV